MTLSLDHIQIGWISALPTEALLADIMLDESINQAIALPPNDNNVYTYGRIKVVGSDASHVVAIAQLPLSTIGKASAATVANNMRRTFPNLKFGIMVGIAGGVWTAKEDVRLGDVVVGIPDDGGPGIIQYDLGKSIQDGEFVTKGVMNKAPDVLRSAAGVLQRKHMRRPGGDFVSSLETTEVKRHASRPGVDNLFSKTYTHQGGDSCANCDEAYLQSRPQRLDSMPKVHYGAIASGDQVVKDAVFAEKIRVKHGIICFEMEAAGLDAFPCLVVRGISDYADTHKNDKWHAYAAATAAAYAKELLSVVPLIAVAGLPSTGNTHWNVPRAPNPLFTGRESLLENMEKHLITYSLKKDRPVFVLQGIGGAGKSEAAIKFATQNQDNFWGIFWVDADNLQSLEEGFKEIARMQSPPLAYNTPKDVLQWLATVKESWLLILDNCDNGEIDFARYMPSRGGSIILTSRLNDCKKYGTCENLDDLGHENAVQLLLRACGYEIDNEAQIPAAQSVVSILGQHALALVHAGAFISKGLCALDQYVQFFQTEQDWLMNFRPEQQSSRYGSVYTTFEVSAQTLASSPNHDDHLALKLLDILAFLNREAVEEDLFVRAFDECYKLESESGLVWEENECKSTAEDLPINYHNSLNELDNSQSTKNVLCTWRGEYSYIADSEALDHKLIKSSSADQSTHQALETIQESLVPVLRQRFLPYDIENFGASDSSQLSSIESSSNVSDNHTSGMDDGCSTATVDAIDHELLVPGTDNQTGEACENDADDENDEYEEDDGEIDHLDVWHCKELRESGLVEHQRLKRFRVARARLADLSLIGVNSNKISMHPLVHEWARTRLGKSARQNAWEQALSLLAMSSIDDRNWHDFTPKLVLHIDTCFRNRKEDENRSRLSLDVVRALYRLGRHSYLDRKFEASLAIFETISDSYEVHPHTASFKKEILLHTKANCLRLLERTEEMRSCLDQIVQSTSKWFESDSVEVFYTQYLLAEYYCATDRFQDAANLLEKMYQLFLQPPPLDNGYNVKHQPSTTQANLCDHERAVDALEEDIEVARMCPSESPYILEDLARLACLYAQLNKPDEAVRSLREVVQIISRYPKAAPRGWLKIMRAETCGDFKLGKPDQGVSFLKEIHPSERFPNDILERADTTDQPARSPLEAHNPYDAVRLLQHLTETDALMLFLTDPRRLVIMGQLASNHLRLGKPHLAVPLLEEVVEIEALSLPPNEPDRLISMDRLAKAYLDLKKPQLAVPVLEEVVKIEASSVASDDRLRLNHMDRLAYAYLKVDKPDKAVSLLEEVVGTEASSVPLNDRDRLNHMDRLAHAYFQLDKPDKALTLLEEVARIAGLNLPVDDQNRLIQMGRLADAYLELQKPDQAVTLLEEVVKIESSNLVQHTSERLISVNRLARCYLELDRSDKAVALLEDIINTYANIPSFEPQLTDQGLLAAKWSLASAYTQKLEFEQAANLMKQTLEQLSQVVPPENQSILNWMFWLGSTLLELGSEGNAHEALSLLEAVHEIDKERLSPGDRDLIRTQIALAGAYLMTSQVQRAVNFLEVATELANRYLPLESRLRLDLISMLGNAYLHAGDVHKAIDILEEVVKLDEEHFEANYEEVLLGKRRLAEAYTKLESHDKIADAVNLLEQVMERGERTLHKNPARLKETERSLSDARARLWGQESRRRASAPITTSRPKSAFSRVKQRIRERTKRAALMF